MPIALAVFTFFLAFFATTPAHAAMQPDKVRLAFAANLAGDGQCHPSIADGADLFLGVLDLRTGEVTDIRLAAGGAGTQWLPVFSDDGWSLTYQDNNAARHTHMTLDLVTFAEPMPVTNALLPFSLPATTNDLVELDFGPDAFCGKPLTWTGWGLPSAQVASAIVEADPDFRNSSIIGLATPFAAGSNSLIATAASLYHLGEHLHSLTSRLFIFQRWGNSLKILPIRFKNFKNAPFSIQACTLAIHTNIPPLPDNAPPLFQFNRANNSLSIVLRKEQQRAPGLYILITARPGSAEPGKASKLSGNATAFGNVREHIERFAAYAISNRMPWALQVDYDFLDAALHFESLKPADAAQSSNHVDGILKKLAASGLELVPVARPELGCNEADAVWLLEQLGLKPAPVAGWYLCNPEQGSCKAFAKYERGMHGKRHPSLFWKPEIIAGAIGSPNQTAPDFTGLWRPASADAFFEHNPQGSIMAAGDYQIMRDTELVSMLGKAQRGEIPENQPAVLRLHIVLPDSQVMPDFEDFLAWRFAHLLLLRDSGNLQITRYTELPQILDNRCGNRGFVYNPNKPGISLAP